MEKVGILGSGDVARALGKGFATLGHEVKLGSREPASDKLAAWKQALGERASTGTFAEAAEFGEILVLATLWAGTKSAIDLAGEQGFAGKILIDVTNPLDFSHGRVPGLALGHTDYGGEQVQRWLPRAREGKAWKHDWNPPM